MHSGRWAFLLGPNKEDGEVILNPGDTISIPVHIFRGFKNIGEDEGFLFAVLGGDDPGHVTWAPHVFDNAKEYGLILLEDGSLVDTTNGEIWEEGGIVLVDQFDSALFPDLEGDAEYVIDDVIVGAVGAL